MNSKVIWDMSVQALALVGAMSFVIRSASVACLVLLSVMTSPNAEEERTLCAAHFAREAELSGYIPVSGEKPVAQTQFHDKDGKALSIADFRGRGVVMNFWATWCAPCIKEMPSLDRLEAKLKNDGIKVLAVNEDDRDMELIARYYLKLGLEHLDMLIDRGKALMRATKVFSLPTTLLIDRVGNEVAGVLGPAEWDDERIVAFLRSCLG